MDCFTPCLHGTHRVHQFAPIVIDAWCVPLKLLLLLIILLEVLLRPPGARIGLGLVVCIRISIRVCISISISVSVTHDRRVHR